AGTTAQPDQGVKRSPVLDFFYFMGNDWVATGPLPPGKGERMTRRLLILPLVLAAGCVSQGTHDELQRRFDEQASELRERHQRIIGLEEALSREEENSERLQARIDQLSREKASLLSDRASLASSVEEMQVALADANRRKAEADERI